MAPAGKNGRQHHEAPRFTHALFQPFGTSSHRHGSNDQLPPLGTLADLSPVQCYTCTQYPRLHGSSSRPPAQLPKPPFPQLHPSCSSRSSWSSSTPSHSSPSVHGSGDAEHGSSSLSVSSTVPWKVPFGGCGPAQLQYCCAEDESQGTHPVYGQDLATHVTNELGGRPERCWKWHVTCYATKWKKRILNCESWGHKNFFGGGDFIFFFTSSPLKNNWNLQRVKSFDIFARPISRCLLLPWVR